MRKVLKQRFVAEFSDALRSRTQFVNCREQPSENGILYEWKLRDGFTGYVFLQILDDRDAFQIECFWSVHDRFPGFRFRGLRTVDMDGAGINEGLPDDADARFHLSCIMGDELGFVWSLRNDSLDETKDSLFAGSIENAEARIPMAVDDCVAKLCTHLIPYLQETSEKVSAGGYKWAGHRLV